MFSLLNIFETRDSVRNGSVIIIFFLIKKPEDQTPDFIVYIWVLDVLLKGEFEFWHTGVITQTVEGSGRVLLEI
jgi:hypothetical protein